jgi:hypothetical protein
MALYGASIQATKKMPLACPTEQDPCHNRRRSEVDIPYTNKQF